MTQKQKDADYTRMNVILNAVERFAVNGTLTLDNKTYDIIKRGKTGMTLIGGRGAKYQLHAMPRGTVRGYEDALCFFVSRVSASRAKTTDYAIIEIGGGEALVAVGRST